jgi:hypothetical protein
MKNSILIMIFFVSAIAALAQESALEKAIVVDPLNYNLDVYVPPGSLKGWSDKTNWVIIVIDGSKTVHRIDIDTINPRSKDSMFSISPTVASAATIANASQIIVNFGSKVIVVAPPKKSGSVGGGQSGAPVAAASNKQTSDIYLSGSYSPGFKGADPQYSLEGSVAVMFDLNKKHLEYGQLGFVASVKTDKRKKVDPDSYRLFLAYQNVLKSNWWGPNKSIQGVQLTWLAAGTEFDRKGKNTNFITAPYLDFPIRLFPSHIRSGTVPMAVLTPSIGFETGWNFHNAVPPNKGSGIFRGFFGADLLFRFNPNIPGFKGIEFANSYVLRAPAIEEIYTLSKKVNNQDVDDSFLNRKPRHYVKSALTFKLNDYFGITTTYEYGMLPPVFRRIDHKVSIGFTFSAKQVNDGVPSTIRSK